MTSAPRTWQVRRLLRRPLVTVVVPVYNTGRFLAECLASIDAQDVPLAVVVVDDGSTDDSLAIARAYADGRDGVEVVSQRNRGPGAGAARNVGLDRTRTPWVMFLDSDDALAPHGLDALLAGLHAHPSDLAVGRVRSTPVERRWIWDDAFEDLTGPQRRRIEDVPSLVHNPAPGNKVFRTAALRERRLTFAEGVHHQDTVVSIPTMLLADDITVSPEVVLHYRRHEGSVMSAHFDRAQNYLDHVAVLERLAPLRRTLGAERRAILDRFFARSLQGFVLRAPGVLAPDRLASFESRAARLFADLDPTLISEMTASAAHRLAYARLLRLDDAPPDRAGEVHAVDGAAYATPAAHPLLRLGRVLASSTTTEIGPDGVELSGTVDIDGADPVATIPGLGLGLRVRGAGLTVPVATSLPGDGSTVPSDGPSGSTRWTTRVPLDGMPEGRFRLRLVVETPEGQLSTGIRSRQEDGVLSLLDGDPERPVRVESRQGVLVLVVEGPRTDLPV